MTGANETYRTHLAEVRHLIGMLGRQVTIHERRQAAQPDDWGFPGDLRRIIEGLREITPVHLDSTCDWKGCEESAFVCLPDGRMACHGHAPESEFGPDECLDLVTGMPADTD